MKRKTPLTPIPVLCRQRYEEPGTPLQQVFEKKFTELPEFDFYKTGSVSHRAVVISDPGSDEPDYSEDLPEFEGHDEETTSHYMQYFEMLYMKGDKPTDTLFKIKRLFMTTRDEAREYERLKNFQKAVDNYEWLVAQEYPLPYAYDRLIKIYKDHNLIPEAIFTAREAIQHFTDLRSRQIKYVGYLADKYGETDYFLDRLLDKQKVFYYGGAFELYNPFPIIDTWKIKLEKLEHARRQSKDN